MYKRFGYLVSLPQVYIFRPEEGYKVVEMSSNFDL